MALQVLDVAGLATVDGGLFAEVVNGAIHRAIEDMQLRQHVTGPRKVTIELVFTPAKIDVHTKELEQVNFTFGFKEALPSRKSGTINCGVKKDGRLVFNDVSQDNVDQRTFDMET